MTDSITAAAKILKDATILNMAITVSEREINENYYGQYINQRLASGFAREIADNLEPQMDGFTKRSVAGDYGFPEVQYRARVVVLTDAEYTALCRHLVTAEKYVNYREMSGALK